MRTTQENTSSRSKRKVSWVSVIGRSFRMRALQGKGKADPLSPRAREMEAAVASASHVTRSVSTLTCEMIRGGSVSSSSKANGITAAGTDGTK